jgi:hypothetical protein
MVGDLIQGLKEFSFRLFEFSLSSEVPGPFPFNLAKLAQRHLFYLSMNPV